MLTPLSVPGLPGDSALLHTEAASSRAILLMLPGGRCAARRYAWLGALAEQGISVCVLDGALLAHVESDGPSPTILQLSAALAVLSQRSLPIHAAGHSAGAAALFDALDPPSNPAARLPREFALPLIPASVTSLGCSLQPRTLDMVLPHRSEDRPLHRPAETRLLFLAGEEDAIAPPSLVGRTCARFTPAAPMIAMRRATHYGWAGPAEAGDQGHFDVDHTLETNSQRARTVAYLERFITSGTIDPVAGDRLEHA
jgi:hypothetical protein